MLREVCLVIVGGSSCTRCWKEVTISFFLLLLLFGFGFVFCCWRMPAVTYNFRPRRSRSGDVLLQTQTGNANGSGGSYRTLQTLFVVCITLAAAFVIILQIKSSEQLVETSIVATLENHDSSPQPTRHPQKVSQASNPKDSLQSTNYLSVPRVPQHLYPQRLDKYCAKNVPTGDNAEKLTEKIADEFSLDLASLVITIRHGDRSAIHVLPNSTMKIPDTVLVAPLSRDFTPFFSNLQLNIIEETNSPSQHKGDDLTKALDSRIVFQRSDMTLPQGQLTSRGFAQHLELGQILHDAYGKAYLQTMLEADQVYVRSTNYARTIQVR